MGGEGALGSGCEGNSSEGAHCTREGGFTATMKESLFCGGYAGGGCAGGGLVSVNVILARLSSSLHDCEESARESDGEFRTCAAPSNTTS